MLWWVNLANAVLDWEVILQTLTQLSTLKKKSWTSNNILFILAKNPYKCYKKVYSLQHCEKYFSPPWFFFAYFSHKGFTDQTDYLYYSDCSNITITWEIYSSYQSQHSSAQVIFLVWNLLLFHVGDGSRMRIGWTQEEEVRKKSNSIFLEEEKCLGVRSFKEDVKILTGSCQNVQQSQGKLCWAIPVWICAIFNVQHEKVLHRQLQRKHRCSRRVRNKAPWISASYKMATSYLSDSRHGSWWS